MADEQQLVNAAARPQTAGPIENMAFGEILHLGNAAGIIWEFDEQVAKALSNELGVPVTTERAGRSSGSGPYTLVTFRIRDTSRKETQGMENYLQVQVNTREGPGITIRLFSFEEGYRSRQPGGAAIPVVDTEYRGEAVDTFDVKRETVKVFVEPYSYALAGWEKQRIENLGRELREFCAKRAIRERINDNPAGLKEYRFEVTSTDDTSTGVGIVDEEYSCVYPDEKFYRKEDVDRLLESYGIKLE